MANINFYLFYIKRLIYFVIIIIIISVEFLLHHRYVEFSYFNDRKRT